MSSQRQATIKVGFMALLSIALLVAVLVWLRGRGIQTGETFEVAFNDVDGLREGAAVQMMGIRVGFIDTVNPVIEQKHYQVRVVFSINQPDIKVPRGSVLSIEQSGIIGEKFLEITPPYDRRYLIRLEDNQLRDVHSNILIKQRFKSGILAVGVVKELQGIQRDVSKGAVDPVEKLSNALVSGNPYASVPTHRLIYRITRPGIEWPEDELVQLTLVTNEGMPYFLLRQNGDVLAEVPKRNAYFTIENPLRLKEFLEIQLESAEALKITNDKLSKVLSDDNIASLSSTVKNTETLTAQANDVLKNANKLFQVAGKDLESLVATSDKLANNLIVVSDNVNGLIGNPDLKEDILSTVHSIQSSTQTLAEIIQDPELKQSIALIEDTTQDTAALVAALKETVGSDKFQNDIKTSSVLLNQSLDKLNRILSAMDEAAVGDDQNIKQIIRDARETTQNMKAFSEKLNGRFTLFRLLF